MFIRELEFNFFVFTAANVNATTATGDTALSFACENGHTDVCDVLLMAGAVLVSKIKKLFVTFFDHTPQGTCSNIFQ